MRLDSDRISVRTSRHSARVNPPEPQQHGNRSANDGDQNWDEFCIHGVPAPTVAAQSTRITVRDQVWRRAASTSRSIIRALTVLRRRTTCRALRSEAE